MWTDLVLNWFANAASSAVTVDTSKPRTQRLERLAPALPRAFTTPRTGHGETLRIDQTHWSWPPYDGARGGYWSKDYWKGVLAGDDTVECLLALECEWGGKDEVAHYYEVMHEAGKLVSMNARAKVLLFATRKIEQRAELHKDIDGLREKGRDTAPWLLVDLPWGHWPAEHRPERKLLAGGWEET